MSALIQTVLIIHVVSGFVALVTGFFSMISRKGGKNHILSGRIFFSGMTGVFITAVTLSLNKSNSFLFIVGFFSYYLACSGYRSVCLKTFEIEQKPSVIDLLITGTGLISGMGLIVASIYWFPSRGVWAMVPLTFGSFCLLIAVKDALSLYRPAEYKQQWLNSHALKMGGAFASTLTAFIVVNFTMGSFTFILWILPGVIIGIWISKILKTQSKIHKESPETIASNPSNIMIGLIFLLLCISAKDISAQDLALKGTTIDECRNPIPYVSIGIKNKPIGTVSDDKGSFLLFIKKETISIKDTVTFSIIGYHSKSPPLSQIISTQEIKGEFILVLNSKVQELHEVTVIPQKGSVKTIGTGKKSALNFDVNFSQSAYPNQNLGSEIGRKFNISQKNTRIEAFKFYLSHNNFDSVKLRINLYSIKRGQTL